MDQNTRQVSHTLHESRIPESSPPIDHPDVTPTKDWQCTQAPGVDGTVWRRLATATCKT